MAVRSFFVALLLVTAAAWPARAVEVQRVVSPGGIEAWLVEDHSNPIISLSLAFRGGAALEPTGKEGLAHLVSGLIDEGAGPHDSQAFQGLLQDLSIDLSFDAGIDAFEGSLRTLTENRATAFDLLRLALTEPRFDAEPVERIRNQILVQLRGEAEDPDTIAGRVLRDLFFPGHPYGRPVNGMPETLAKLTVQDLRDFVGQRFARDNLVVSVVGDVAADELARLLDETFMALPAQAAPGTVPEVTAGTPGEVVIVQRAIPQSVAVFGHNGIKRDDPDFYAAYVVNYILGGGGFASRLYEEVREKRGLAYSVYSYLASFDHAGMILGGVATANAQVAESLALIREQWADMAENGPTAEELADAKSYLTGSYALRLTSSGRIAEMLVGIQLENLGIDYMDRRNGLIEAVTLEDAKRVAARLYDPAALTVVVVGQPENLQATMPAPLLAQPDSVEPSAGGAAVEPSADGAGEEVH